MPAPPLVRVMALPTDAKTASDPGVTPPAVDMRDDASDARIRRSLLENMIMLRALDERMTAKQRQGAVGFYGAVTGQEAVPFAAAAAARDSDWVFPALRESAILLARGFPLATYLAQIYGVETDVAKGRQMPSHMAARQAHVVSWSSCIGTQLPHAVGAAMAAKQRGDEMVSLAFSGDGGTSEGDFHAAMNFAGVYAAPVVFVVQNNHWAISVPSAKQTASQGFAIKAEAYGMPGIRVDGNDALATYAVLRDAIARARRDGGPTLVEAVTYRIGAHSSSDDPSRYRDDAEVERWRARDPIARLRSHLTALGEWDDAQEQTHLGRVSDEITAAIRTVEAVARPDAASLFDDVYAKTPAHLRDQHQTLMRYPAPHSQSDTDDVDAANQEETFDA